MAVNQEQAAGLGFTADWLTLREPFDHAARAGVVTAAALAYLAGRTSPLVVDLGCGRGSNLRFLRPRLGTGVRWRLVDHDRELLDAAAGTLAAEDVVELCQADLRAGDLENLVDGADLVSAAALLDLVDAAWLAAFVAAVEASSAALVVTGTVDGRVAWEPAVPADASVIAAYTRHQGGEKGFGRALGTTAAARLEALLAERGWQVTRAPGDWDRVGDPVLQRVYLDGVLAALADAGMPVDDLAAWRQDRVDAIEAGTSRLTVGHVDLFALPPSPPGG